MGSGLTDPRQAARSANPDAKVSISDMPMANIVARLTSCCIAVFAVLVSGY